MLKISASVLLLVFLSQYNVKGMPLSNDNSIKSDDIEIISHARTFDTILNDSPRFPYAWTIPYSSFSITSLFDNNDILVLKQNMATLQKNQEEIMKLLKQLTEAISSSVSSPVPINDNSQNESQNVDYIEHPIINGIVNKEGGIIENTQEDKIQNESNNAVINTDDTNITSASTNEEKIEASQEDKEEVTTSVKNNSSDSDDYDIDYDYIGNMKIIPLL